MTVDDLITEAKHNRTGRADADALSPPNLSECLRFALDHLLEDIDYDSDPRAGASIAARMIATIITCADEAQS